MRTPEEFRVLIKMDYAELILDDLTPAERCELFAEYCCTCGVKNDFCQCQTIE